MGDREEGTLSVIHIISENVSYSNISSQYYLPSSPRQRNINLVPSELNLTQEQAKKKWQSNWEENKKNQEKGEKKDQ